MIRLAGMRDEATVWAEQAFGSAALGDRRRSARLVRMAAAVARCPAGTVTGVFANAAEQEGAFRFLENPAVRSEAVASAVFAATAREARGRVVVAVDGSSVTLGDRAGKRELGRVGNTVRQTRGLHVMTALCMDEDGAPLGLMDQRFWAREQPPARRRHTRKCYGKRYLQTETRHWVDTLVDCQQRVAEHSPSAEPWFQLDRGADAWPVLKTAVDGGMLVTVRAHYNRRLRDSRGRRTSLNTTLERQPVLGTFTVNVAAQPGRPARKARVALRATPVTVNARVTKKRREALAMYAVVAEETSRRKDRIRWRLLTTHPVHTVADAREVVAAYSRRWRVEEFHRAWKSGVCNVEATQLHGRSAIVKWATMLAAVAARALRIAYLNRTCPDEPATVEFTEDEIEALYLLTRTKRDRRRRLTLGEVIKKLAIYGGYAHQYNPKRRPGPKVIARGLAKVSVLATGLKNMREMR